MVYGMNCVVLSFKKRFYRVAKSGIPSGHPIALTDIIKFYQNKSLLPPQEKSGATGYPQLFPQGHFRRYQLIKKSYHKNKKRIDFSLFLW